MGALPTLSRSSDGRDQRARAAAAERDAEEALELQAPEARQVGDRGVFGGEDGIQSVFLQQPVEGVYSGVVRHRHAPYLLALALSFLSAPAEAKTITVRLAALADG